MKSSMMIKATTCSAAVLATAASDTGKMKNIVFIYRHSVLPSQRCGPYMRLDVKSRYGRRCCTC